VSNSHLPVLKKCNSFLSNQSYKLHLLLEFRFLKEIILPESSQATSLDDSREVYWEFMAGLDMKGNDPDSGWIKANIDILTA
ncbi:hypothetical protein, partial [Williamwhitmania taraxaci]|uniref:hypothetical protein n=1 Tax=Williamwhitmania taraxaci TaxID=1640674 RepID=UPI001BB02807